MKIFHSRIKIMIGIGVSTALLLGCGSSSSSDSANVGANSAYGIYGKTVDSTVMASNMGGQIMIAGSAFTVSGDVKSSDAITVANHDSFKHTVTSDNGVFDVTVEGGATESLPSLSPGVYTFHCKIHTSMLGTLTVT